MSDRPATAIIIRDQPAWCLRGPDGNFVTLFARGAQVWQCQIGGQERLFQAAHQQWPANHLPRGGIPLCWPWLGRHPQYPNAGLHGPLRQQMFQWEAHGRDARRAWLRLGCHVGPDLSGVLSNCHVQLSVAIGLHHLMVGLRISNHGKRPQPSAGALHTYLRIPVHTAVVHGLDGCPWHGPDDSDETGVVSGAISNCAGQTRTVHHAGQSLTLGRDQQTLAHMRSLGSRSVVLWNPGPGSGISDLEAPEWQDFLCFETANSDHDARQIPPGSQHLMVTRYRFSGSPQNPRPSRVRPS